MQGRQILREDMPAQALERGGTQSAVLNPQAKVAARRRGAASQSDGLSHELWWRSFESERRTGECLGFVDEANELPRLWEKKRSGKVRRFYHCPCSRTSAATPAPRAGAASAPVPSSPPCPRPCSSVRWSEKCARVACGREGGEKEGRQEVGWRAGAHNPSHNPVLIMDI